MTKPSIFFWIIAVILLLWNAMGAFDFTMTMTRNEAYMGQYPQNLLDYWYSFPIWVSAAWGLAVWSGVAGAILMLLRRKVAVTALILSLICFVLTFIYTLVTGGQAMQADYLGPAAHGFTALVFFLTVFAVWYAHRARAKGYLR